MFKLVIQDDEGKTTVVPVLREELTIGRKEGNTIRLTERNVSRSHAKLYRSNGSIAIEDLDSYNGIRVNGSRIQGRVELKESDRVQIGDYLIEVKADAAAKVDPEDKTQPIERVDPFKTAPLPQLHTDDVSTIPTRKVPDGTAPGIPAAPAPEQPTPIAEAAEPPAARTSAQIQAETEPGRLVVLSSNFAGAEYTLDKPAMVIGRTDENDVWLNHRSISRHHAKILHENGRYAIVDLQSSNGVRVNGEEYGKVELRRGDVIDLGHVRLRFVEPGEDFVFGRDAHAVDIPGSSGSRMAMWALLAILAGVGVFVFAYIKPFGGGDTVGSGGSPGGTSTGQQSDTNGTDPRPDASVVAQRDGAATGEPDAAVELVDAGPDPAVQVAELLVEAEQALTGLAWSRANQAAKSILAIDSGHARAAAIRKLAEAEIVNERVFGRLKECQDNDWNCIAAEYRKISSDSHYREDALRIRNEAGPRYADAMRRLAATRLRRTTYRDECTRELGSLERASLWEEGRSAIRDVRRDCSDKPEKEETPPDKPDDPEPDAEALANQASAAYKSSKYPQAFRLCRRALSARPGYGKAVLVCALAACRLKNAQAAQRYYGQMRGAQKSMIRQQCVSAGVNL